jgi:hypothetical protein
MRSALQNQTSRSNSQESTGPRTEAGKAVSSQNALQTGIYAEAEIIRGENPADLAALAAEYTNSFQPEAPEQRCLVDILIHSEWTLSRLRRAEAQFWGKQIDASNWKARDNQVAPYPLARAIDYEYGPGFTRLQSRINATQRNYERALKELKRLQEDRTKEQPPAKLDPGSAGVSLGFVPSSLPAPSPEPEIPPAAARKAPILTSAGRPSHIEYANLPFIAAS